MFDRRRRDPATLARDLIGADNMWVIERSEGRLLLKSRRERTWLVSVRLLAWLRVISVGGIINSELNLRNRAVVISRSTYLFGDP